MPNLKSLFVFVLIYIGVAAANQSYAQIGHQESEKDYWYAYIDGLWADGGYGLSTIGKSAITNFNMQFGDSTLVTLGASKTWEHYSNYIRASDYYAMAGYIFKKKSSVSAFQAGLSYSMMKDYRLDFSNNSVYPALITNSYNRIGIAIQGKFYYCPMKFLGIGINVFADVNPHQTHGSLLFSIAIGKLNYLY